MTRQQAAEHGHPALEAWRRLRPRDGSPCVELLAERPDGRAVYRLRPPGGAVPLIAKRCDADTAQVERRIYESVLPRAGIAAPTFHGLVAERPGGLCWLFLDEVCGAAYREHDAGDRRIAGRWLGRLHAAAASSESARSLPDRAPGHYRRLLTALSRALEARLEGAGPPALREPLRRVLRHCLRMEARWTALEERCRGGPRTLVHGDFVAHNVFLRPGTAVELMVIDWEKAGWGTPAEDLSSVDLASYRDATRSRWPSLDLPALERLALAGRFFRCLVFLDWVLPRLDREPADAVSDLDQCDGWLATLSERVGW